MASLSLRVGPRAGPSRASSTAGADFVQNASTARSNRLGSAARSIIFARARAWPARGPRAGPSARSGPGRAYEFRCFEGRSQQTALLQKAPDGMGDTIRRAMRDQAIGKPIKRIDEGDAVGMTRRRSLRQRRRRRPLYEPPSELPWATTNAVFPLRRSARCARATAAAPRRVPRDSRGRRALGVRVVRSRTSRG